MITQKVITLFVIFVGVFGTPAPTIAAKSNNQKQSQKYHPESLNKLKSEIQKREPQFAPRNYYENLHQQYEAFPATFDFNYAIADEYSGNDFGHQETREGYDTQGSYYVLLPDGRKQIVTYYVNADSGYVAKVEYEGETIYPALQQPHVYHSNHHPHNSQPLGFHQQPYAYQHQPHIYNQGRQYEHFY